MSAINPELDAATGERNLRPVAIALFGTGNASVVKALGRFLVKPYGRLDEVNLRLIAAAAPSLEPDHVAKLIDTLPITSSNLSMAAPHKGVSELQFGAVFADVPSAARPRLLGSLIQQTTIRLLELSPFDQLPPQSKALLDNHFHQRIRTGGVQDSFEALLHEGSTDQHLVAAQERFSGRLEAALLLARFTTDPATLIQLSMNAEDHVALSLNDALPREAINAIHHKIHPDYGRWTITNTVPRWIGSVRSRISTVDVPTTRARAIDLALLRRSNIDPALFDAIVERSLATLSGSTSRRILERDPFGKLQDELDHAYEVIKYAAASPHVPRVTLEKIMAAAMAHPDGERVSCAVIKNTVLSPHSVDQHARVSIVLARAAALRDDLLETTAHYLFSLKDRSTTLALAANPSIPKVLRQTFAQSEDLEVLLNLCNNSAVELGFVQGVFDSATAHLEAISNEESIAWQQAYNTVQGRLIEAGRLSDPETVALYLASMDIHDALRLCAGNRLADGVGVQTIAKFHIDSSFAARVDGFELRPGKLRQWSDLPNTEDRPIEVPAHLNVFEVQAVRGLVGKVARTGREVRDLKHRMGNCLDTFIPAAMKKEVVIVAYEDPAHKELYAAALDIWTSGRISLREVNSLQDGQILPRHFERDLSQLVDQVNQGFAPSVTPSVPAVVPEAAPLIVDVPEPARPEPQRRSAAIAAEVPRPEAPRSFGI